MDRIEPRRRRRPSRQFAVTLAVLLGLPALVLGWWLFLATVDPAPYVAYMDELPVPSSWELVHTQTIRDALVGSRADRYYFVDGEPQEIAPIVQQVLRSAGLEIYFPDYYDSKDVCVTPAPDAVLVTGCPVSRIGTCEEINTATGGPVRCTVQAFRWLSNDPPFLERLSVYISPRGGLVDVGVGNEHRLVDTSNRVLVRISADRATGRFFWASPTPRAS